MQQNSRESFLRPGGCFIKSISEHKTKLTLVKANFQYSLATHSPEKYRAFFIGTLGYELFLAAVRRSLFFEQRSYAEDLLAEMDEFMCVIHQAIRAGRQLIMEVRVKNDQSRIHLQGVLGGSSQ